MKGERPPPSSSDSESSPRTAFQPGFLRQQSHSFPNLKSIFPHQVTVFSYTHNFPWAEEHFLRPGDCAQLWTQFSPELNIFWDQVTAVNCPHRLPWLEEHFLITNHCTKSHTTFPDFEEHIPRPSHCTQLYTQLSPNLKKHFVSFKASVLLTNGASNQGQVVGEMLNNPGMSPDSNNSYVFLQIHLIHQVFDAWKTKAVHPSKQRQAGRPLLLSDIVVRLLWL